MTISLNDTICAIASAQGGSPRGIVRISGDDALKLLETSFEEDSGYRGSNGSAPDAANASVLTGKWKVRSIIEAVPCHVLIWPDEKSYTRQPSLEIHTVGSPALLEILVDTICHYGARLAEPGEFTMRAFLAGRIDLTQAEAVLGVINAESSTDLKVSLNQLSGGLAHPMNALRDKLLELLAHLEAGLDFVEEDIEFISAEKLDQELEKIESQISRLAQQVNTRSRTDFIPRVVLIGMPNAGKSSLFNAIAEQSLAIVTDQAGTTRDYLEVEVEYEGTRFRLVDTAGLESNSPESDPSSLAQLMTQSQFANADLRLICVDPKSLEQHPALFSSVNGLSGIPESDLKIENSGATNSDELWVVTKSDLGTGATAEKDSGVGSSADMLSRSVPTDAILTSSKTSHGLKELLSAIKNSLDSSTRNSGNVVKETAQRCWQSLQAAADAITESRELARASLGEELVAEKMRHSLEELGQVAGVVYTDDILDRVFSRFCIGK